MRDQHNTLFDSAVSKIRFEITDGAYNINENGWKLNDSIAAFTRIYFVETGKAVMEYNSTTMELLPGYVYLVPTNLNFKAYSESEHSKLYFFFKILLPDGSDMFSGINDIMSLNVGASEIARVKKLFLSKNIVDIAKLKSTIIEYALRMVPGNKQRDVSSVIYSPEIQKVIEYIDKNLSIQLSIKSISEHFGIPATTLSKHFNKEVGRNIGKYIDDMVFDRAKAMLASNEHSIQEISDMLGFCDRFYFSRRFKEKIVITPNKYRKLRTTTIR